MLIDVIKEGLVGSEECEKCKEKRDGDAEHGLETENFVNQLDAADKQKMNFSECRHDKCCFLFRFSDCGGVSGKEKIF